jgi:ankyrin repeat protein
LFIIQNGKTAYEIAINNNNYDAIAAFEGFDPSLAAIRAALDKDPDRKEKELYLAAKAGKAVDVLRVLTSSDVDKDVDINWRNKDAKKQTPLWIACDNGHLEVVELLVGKGADIELPNEVIL